MEKEYLEVKETLTFFEENFSKEYIPCDRPFTGMVPKLIQEYAATCPDCICDPCCSMCGS
jgi:hypothetical protein